MSSSKPIAVSVIAPVYAVENYIEQCIDSLKAQSLENMEFIFIDDCSPDNSMTHIELWAQEDSRVRILRNDVNLGCGPSRNRGMKVARGEYFAPLDPDDYVSPDYYLNLYRAAKAGDFDIAKAQIIYFDDATGRTIYTSIEKDAQIEELYQAGVPMLLTSTFEHTSALYKRSLYMNEDVFYAKSMSEDSYFLTRCLSFARSITTVSTAQYYWRRGHRSLSSSVTYESLCEDIDTLRGIVDFILQNPDESVHPRYLCSLLPSRINRLWDAYVHEDDKDKFIACRALMLEQISRMVEAFPSLKDDWVALEAPQLSAFIHYGFVIPAPGHGYSFSSDCAQRWLEFLVEHPEASNRTYLQTCAKYLVRQHLVRVKATLLGHKKEPGASPFFVQLNKLDPERKQQILKMLPKQFVDLCLGALCRIKQ